MKKWTIAVSMIFIMTLLGTAAEKVVFKDGESAIFKINGKMTVKTLVDMSSRTGKLEFDDETAISRDDIWMINFLNKNWRWHKEREKLSPTKDTVILKNDGIIKDEIIDFSKNRRVLEFKKHGPVHISKIKRIYFCCTPLPEPYKEMMKQDAVKSRKVYQKKHSVIKKVSPKKDEG